MKEDSGGCECVEEGGGGNVSRKLKGKVLMSCVRPAYLYGLETVALTERQQQRLQVCENNWVRKGCWSEEGGYKEDG